MKVLTKVGKTYRFAPRADGAPATKADVWLSVYNAIHAQPNAGEDILAALNASDACETQRHMTHRALHRWNDWTATLSKRR